MEKQNNIPILSKEELKLPEKIAQVFSIDGLNKQVVKMELLEQAKNYSLPMRAFNSLLKEAERMFNESQKLDFFNCIPSNFPDRIHKVIEDCGKYKISENGIFIDTFTPFGMKTEEVISHPIFIIQRIKDIDTNEEKVRIAYFRKSRGWNFDILIDSKQIASTKGIVELSKYGILANDENSKKLVKYFADLEAMNESKIKVVNSCSYLGKVGDEWIPYSKNIVYNLSNKDCKRRFELYKENGDFETWREWQNKVCRFTIPKICIATAYASLLMETFGLNPFGVHLWGETGKGKSVSIVCAASVYGYPDIKNGIVYTGNTTANGLEPRLAFNRNFCFFLDELSMLTPTQIDNMIYLAMQGQGKARMAKSSEAQNTYYWNLCTLSNSEMPITNDYSKGGIFNRIIQLSTQQSIFQDMNMPEICEVFMSNYGFGAKRFIDLFETAEIKEELKISRKHYYSQLIQNTEDKQANSASILLAAYELARKYIYKSDCELTINEIKNFLLTTDEISQVMRLYEKFIEWVQANYNKFDGSNIGDFQAKWGKFTDITNNNEKYKRVDILPMRMAEFCDEAGINLTQFIIGLKERNLLIHQDKRNTNVYFVNEKSQRCYSVIIGEDYQKFEKKPITGADIKSGNATGNPPVMEQKTDDFLKNMEVIKDDNLPF